MALIVQKFGGSSVADRDRVMNVARIVAQTHAAGNDVVVVVSAQGDTTDELIAKAGEITHDASQREMDMLMSAGEQSHPGVAAKMFERLYECNINIRMIATSEIKISVIIAKQDADRAVAAVHDAFFQ